MIYTCSYKNFKTELLKGVSISKDKGKDADWNKSSYLKLAPKEDFFRTWKENIGKISDEENNKYYIEEYYKQVLSKLDPLQVYRDLDYSFLLCYEDGNAFCHRHIVSAWFELFLGFEVKECKVEGLFVEESQREQYDFIKKTLIDVIKKNTNMRGFHSIRALYLFNKGEKLEKKAKHLEEIHNKPFDELYQAAAYLRCDADEKENEYLNNINKLKKVQDKKNMLKYNKKVY